MPQIGLVKGLLAVATIVIAVAAGRRGGLGGDGDLEVKLAQQRPREEGVLLAALFTDAINAKLLGR